MKPATTLTVLSKASVSTATDCVSHQAMILKMNNPTAITATTRCSLKFNSACVFSMSGNESQFMTMPEFKKINKCYLVKFRFNNNDRAHKSFFSLSFDNSYTHVH